MLSSLNDSPCPAPKLPGLFLLELEGLSHSLKLYEDTVGTGIELDTGDLLLQLVDCMQSEETALDEVDYYCLTLVSEHCNGDLYYEFEKMLEFILYLGKAMYAALQKHRAYRAGVLPYTYRSRHGQALCLQREDLFYDQLSRELGQDQPARAPTRGVGYEKHFTPVPTQRHIERARHGRAFNAGV